MLLKDFKENDEIVDVYTIKFSQQLKRSLHYSLNVEWEVLEFHRHHVYLLLFFMRYKKKFMTIVARDHKLIKERQFVYQVDVIAFLEQSDYIILHKQRVVIINNELVEISNFNHYFILSLELFVFISYYSSYYENWEIEWSEFKKSLYFVFDVKFIEFLVYNLTILLTNRVDLLY